MSSFSFFKPSKPKNPTELVKVTRYALLALDNSDARVVEKQAIEEVERNLLAIKQILLGDGEAEPSCEQVAQLVTEACREDFLDQLVQKLATLSWEGRKEIVQIWGAVLKLKTGYCLSYIEEHVHLLDFLVLLCHQNKEAALNAGNMLRECAKYPKLAKYLLESSSFDLFFTIVELQNFDIASDAFTTFKELLTKHELMVSEYLSNHYAKFFGLYEHLLTSSNYVTRRQSLKLLGDLLLEKPNASIMMRYISEVKNLRIMMTLLKDTSKIIQALAFHLFKVFVANPRKPADIVKVLLQNRDKLLKFLENFHMDKEDEQFEEEKELLIKELEGLIDQ